VLWLMLGLGGLAPLPGVASPGEMVPAGQTVEVRLGRRLRGLESGLERGTSYERALEAVHARRYRQAADLFMASMGEFHQAALAGRISFARSRALMYKARFEAEQAEHLLRAERESARRPSLELRAEAAAALHNLYLTASAYFEREDTLLLDRAQKAYRLVLGPASGDAGDPMLARVRLGYAGLLAMAGQRRAAAAEYARALDGEPQSGPELLLAQAHYFAAMGMPDRAFRVLVELGDSVPDWIELRALLRVANDFDALREDPRFPRVLGGED
jgi:tetratricopeptide (TPR) repeat protein